MKNGKTDDEKWLDISPALIEIAKRASQVKTVEEVDQCIDEYRQVLNGQTDRFDSLDVIFEYRNSIVEHNQIQHKYGTTQD